MTLDEAAALVNANSIEKGFWPKIHDVGHDHITTKIMLIVTELSEAVEELRSGNGNHSLEEIRVGLNNKPEGFAIELIDALIRLLDLCGFLGIPVEHYLIEKHTYNTTRPHKHGKSF